MALLFSLLSAALFGVADFFGGVTSRRVAVLLVVFWSEIAGLVLALVASPLFGGSFPSPGDIVLSVCAGASGVVGIVFLYRGFSEGRISVVAPTSAVLTAVIPVGAGLVWGERPSALAWWGVVLGLPAIALIASSFDSSSGQSGAHLGALAGVGFGLFFVLIVQTSESAGFWPLAGARSGSLLVTTALLLRRRQSPRPPPKTLAPMLWVGIGDMAANVAFFVAARAGMIALVAVVVSLYPAFTVFLARFLLHERMGRSQTVGLGLAGLAVVLIAGG